MKDILGKFLKKLNVTEFSQLTAEEKETYRNWEATLSGRKLTDEDVSKFLEAELDATEVKLVSPNSSTREDLFLKMKLEFIRKLRVFLRSPEIERQMLEENINNLIK